jgi:hypothetical protein
VKGLAGSWLECGSILSGLWRGLQPSLANWYSLSDKRLSKSADDGFLKHRRAALQVRGRRIGTKMATVWPVYGGCLGDWPIGIVCPDKSLSKTTED